MGRDPTAILLAKIVKVSTIFNLLDTALVRSYFTAKSDYIVLIEVKLILFAIPYNCKYIAFIIGANK